MADIMRLHFDMQEEGVNEHPIAKCHVFPHMIIV